MSSISSLNDVRLYALIGIWIVVLSDEALQKAYNWLQVHCKEVIDACTFFKNTYEDYKTSGGIGKTHLKNDARDNCKQKMSHFANEHIRFNRDVPHDLLIKLGLVPDDEDVKKSSDSYVDSPITEIILNGRRTEFIGVRYLGRKPVERCACQIRYCIATTPPSDADAMENATEEIFSRNPWEHSFPGKRGQIFYYSVRWLLLNGEAGQWSEVKFCAIP